MSQMIINHRGIKPKKSSTPREANWINCGTPDDAFLAYLSMFRYAFGRMTYMPSTIIDIIKANASRLTLRTLEQLDRELTEAAEAYERLFAGKDKVSSNYGMECDRTKWLNFHAWVKEQINLHLSGNPAGK